MATIKLCYYSGEYSYKYLGEAYTAYQEHTPEYLQYSFDDYISVADKRFLLPPEKYTLKNSWLFKGGDPGRFIHPYVDDPFYKYGLHLVDGLGGEAALSMLKGFVDRLREAKNYSQNKRFLDVISFNEDKLCDCIQNIWNDANGFLRVMVTGEDKTSTGSYLDPIWMARNGANDPDPAASLDINHRTGDEIEFEM